MKTMTVKNTTATARETMRAVVRPSYGSVQQVRLADVPRPVPGHGQVLIEVHAAGVDRGVWHLVTGLPYLVRLAGFGVTKPKNPILGLDVAGRVVAAGAGVERFATGDEVFGFAPGSFAEYVVAEQSSLAHKPASMTFEQAAAAPVSGVTALQALTDLGRVQPGQSVLVIGASGGVGSYAVQLAGALGARVTGVASGAKADLVRSLGASEAIDYEKSDYLDGSRHYDLIVDTGGRNSLRRLRKALAARGALVVVGGEGGGRWTGGFGRQIRAVLLSPFVSQRLVMLVGSQSHELVDRLGAFLDSGEVTPAVGHTYALDRAPEAIADLVSGLARGKSVITVR
jgi:NADPH:quinone reductase-like Zn-dependent oxidoreductase